MSFGTSITKNSRRWKKIQAAVGVTSDGFPGTETVIGLESRLGIKYESTPARKPADKVNNVISSFPSPDHSSMVNFYGRAGDESDLVKIVFPYPMRLYTREAEADYRRSRCHHKVHGSLIAIFENLLEHFGKDGIREHGLDVFGGIFNDRSVRGGKSKSKHAWGCAIDINPGENRNRQKWSSSKVGTPGFANMPVEAIQIFEFHGWKSGGRAWGRDAMHFQATK